MGIGNCSSNYFHVPNSSGGRGSRNSGPTLDVPLTEPGLRFGFGSVTAIRRAAGFPLARWYIFAFLDFTEQAREI